MLDQPWSVPLFVIEENRQRGGTGFIARYSDKTWIVTAAHLAVYQKEPHCDWSKWPKIMGWHTPDGPVGLTIIRETPQPTPAFAYVLNDNGSVADILCRELKGDVLKHINSRIYNLDPPAVDLAQNVFIRGYPTDIEEWPNSESTVKVRITALPLYGLKFSPLARHGFSGGPIVSESGELIGMVRGTDRDNAVGIGYSTEAIRFVIDSWKS